MTYTTYHRMFNLKNRTVPVLEQQLLTLPENLSSRPVCYGSFLYNVLSTFLLSFLTIVLSVLRFTASDYTFGIFWLHLWYLLITPLVSCEYTFGILWLHLWYLLITPLVSSDYTFGIFWLHRWYLVSTPLVSCEYTFGILWLHLWYLLITPLVSSNLSYVYSILS